MSDQDARSFDHGAPVPVQTLVRVTRGSAAKTVPASLVAYFEARGWSTEQAAGQVDATSTAPARNASTAAWVAYATELGHDPDAVADLTRAELIELTTD